VRWFWSRALVLDFLWSLADEIERWAARSRAEVEQWADLDAQGRTERGLDLMRAAIRADGPGRPARPG
jgi:hypothetical protein